MAMSKHSSSDVTSVDTTTAKSPSLPAKRAVATKAAAKTAPSTVKPAAAKKVAAAKKAPKAQAQASAASPKPGSVDKTSKKAAKLRPQLVRDSFTMPEADFGLIAALKAKALDARRAAKKSELLRAGLRLLSGLEAKALVAALDKLEPVKIGRPKKGH
jgi:hypothetical protein